MQTKQLIKLIVLNLTIIVINVAAFSEGLLNWSVTSRYIPERAAGLTLILMSVVVFIYGNYRLLVVKTSILDYDMNELNKPEEYVEALERYRSREVIFVEDIDMAIDQIRRLNRKIGALNEVLLKNYKEKVDGMYALQNVLSDSRELLFDNIKKMMNRMSVFDQEEYARLKSVNIDNETLHAKWTWFNQNIEYVKKIVENNEKILLEFDHLLIEVSNLDHDDDLSEEKGLEQIQNTVAAMRKLRNRSKEEDEAMNELEKKYQ